MPCSCTLRSLLDEFGLNELPHRYDGDAWCASQ